MHLKIQFGENRGGGGVQGPSPSQTPGPACCFSFELEHFFCVTPRAQTALGPMGAKPSSSSPLQIKI